MDNTIIVYRNPFERDFYEFWTSHPEAVCYVLLGVCLVWLVFWGYGKLKG